jgi:rhodanese-related sulfurtransferase
MSEPIASITARALSDRIARGEPMALLDVREPWERAWASIPVPSHVVDVHIPMGHVTSMLDEIRQSSDARHLVVYCHHGVRSRMVAEWLAGQGVGVGVGRVANLEGGIETWSVEVDSGVRRY